MECSSYCESDTLPELESASQATIVKIQNADDRRMFKNKQAPDINSTKLVDMMLGRGNSYHRFGASHKYGKYGG